MFVETMFLDHGYAIYSANEDLFKSFILKFPEFESEKTKGYLVEILVEMMLDNKKLIRHADTPYYFMEFFLHEINQCTH